MDGGRDPRDSPSCWVLLTRGWERRNHRESPVAGCLYRRGENRIGEEGGGRQSHLLAVDNTNTNSNNNDDNNNDNNEDLFSSLSPQKWTQSVSQ